MDVSSARKGCGHARVIGFDYVMMVMTAKRAARAKAKDKRDDFRRESMAALQDANVPFLIGGSYVVEAYPGVSRRSKDFDLSDPIMLMRPSRRSPALDTKRKRLFRIGLPKPGAAGNTLI
jgi:hypothetical protein